MKMMICGYSEVGRGLRTLRLSGLDAVGTEIREEAVSYPDGSTDEGLLISGRTDKTGRWASDNEVRVILHDIRAAEAVHLARALLQHAAGYREGETAEERADLSSALAALVTGLWRFWTDESLAPALIGQAQKTLAIKATTEQGPADTVITDATSLLESAKQTLANKEPLARTRPTLVHDAEPTIRPKSNGL